MVLNAFWTTVHQPTYYSAKFFLSHIDIQNRDYVKRKFMYMHWKFCTNLYRIKMKRQQIQNTLCPIELSTIFTQEIKQNTNRIQNIA